MVTEVQPSTNYCYDLFIEPFKHGFHNITNACFGTKLEVIDATAVDNLPQFEYRGLSLAERVGSAIVGVLLIIPIVNAVVMLILKAANSDFIDPNIDLNIHTPNRWRYSDQDDSEINITPPPNDEPIAPIDLAAISADQMTARKREALNRLAEIQGMVPSAENTLSELNNRFRLHSQILRFDLAAVLQRYETTDLPSKLFDFLDWAGINDDDERANFRRIVLTYDNFITSADAEPNGYYDDRYQTAANLLSKLAEYFSQQQARVVPGSPEEDALKEQFGRVVTSIIDANNNCITQTISQIQTLLLDVIADGDAASNGNSTHTKIIYRASLAMCKYRASLIKEIIARQNPNDHSHVYIERDVIQRVARLLRLNESIINSDANDYYDEYGDPRVHAALRAFGEEYKPFEHLVKELRTYHGAYQSLRNELLIWASEYYDFGDEPGANLPDGTAAPDMEPRLSEDPANILSNGGNFNYPGLVSMLEALGLVRPIAPQSNADAAQE
ncbi:MAG: hypothetical protein JSR57_09815 [Verrucomicrobia bacterium]|nr:hypothetical protein [Verrucomicrobiota bacterium]